MIISIQNNLIDIAKIYRITKINSLKNYCENENYHVYCNFEIYFIGTNKSVKIEITDDIIKKEEIKSYLDNVYLEIKNKDNNFKIEDLYNEVDNSKISRANVFQKILENRLNKVREQLLSLWVKDDSILTIEI